MLDNVCRVLDIHRNDTPITEDNKYSVFIVEKILLGFNEIHLLCQNMLYHDIRWDIRLTAKFESEHTFVDRIPGFRHYPKAEKSGDLYDYTLFWKAQECDCTKSYDKDKYTEFIPILPMIMRYETKWDNNNIMTISIGFNEPYHSFIKIDQTANDRTYNRLEILHPEYFTFDGYNDDLYTIIFTTTKVNTPYVFFPEVTGDPSKTEYLRESRFPDLITGKQYTTYLYRKYQYNDPEFAITDYNYSICDRPCYNNEFIQTMYAAILKEINENTDIVRYLDIYKTPMIAKVYPTRSKTYGRYLLVVE